MCYRLVDPWGTLDNSLGHIGQLVVVVHTMYSRGDDGSNYCRSGFSAHFWSRSKFQSNNGSTHIGIMIWTHSILK